MKGLTLGRLLGWLPRLERLDLPLVLALLILAGVGLLGVYSAGGESMLMRHVVRLALAFGAMLALAHVEPRYYREWAPWLYLGSLLALLVVLQFGYTVKGAQRWLVFAGVQFQPSELAKVVTPLMVAACLAKRERAPGLRAAAVALGVIALPVLLIGGQPDLGTAVILAAAGVVLLFISGLSWWLLGSLGLAGLASMPIAWYFMEDYQRARVMTFLDPEKTPFGSGYHIIQSKIAIGSGGLYGKGWTNGTQSQLEFLPERSTDFVFAVLSEEFGLLGVTVLLVLFGFVILRGLWIALQSQETFGQLVGAALVSSFFLHVVVNVAMVAGLLPVVGLPLPLISYGGTSLVTMMAAFGILMSMYSHRRILAG